ADKPASRELVPRLPSQPAGCPFAPGDKHGPPIVQDPCRHRDASAWLPVPRVHIGRHPAEKTAPQLTRPARADPVSSRPPDCARRRRAEWLQSAGAVSQSTVDAVDEVEDVGRAKHVSDDENHQKQHDDADNTRASRRLIQLLIELRKLRWRQTVDALLNLSAFDAHGLKFLLYIGVFEHRQQLLAVNLLLVFGNDFRRAYHCSLGQGDLRKQHKMHYSQNAGYSFH